MRRLGHFAPADKADWRYRCLIALASPLIITYTLWRANKDGGKRYLSQRLGFYSKDQQQAANSAEIWIHAASVGELVTVLPLIKRIKVPLLVTTTTPTGAAALERENLHHVTHEYLPIDFSYACQGFLTHKKLQKGWIVETEIWPCLFSAARNHQISLSIINARLTDKTSRLSHGVLSTAFIKALRGVTVMARSADDAKRYIELGSQPEITTPVGNLKYAHSNTSKIETQALIQDVYFLAASTHEDEEIQIAREWNRRYKKEIGEAILVIAPRHPERGERIARQLAESNIPASRRSLGEPLSGKTSIYIADTMGELQCWYTHAKACFVGGSLIRRGGHNMLEPARVGCPIISGPHTFNFQDIVANLLAHESMSVAQNATQVLDFFAAVHNDRKTYQYVAERARQRAILSEGILDEYLARLM